MTYPTLSALALWIASVTAAVGTAGAAPMNPEPGELRISIDSPDSQAAGEVLAVVDEEFGGLLVRQLTRTRVSTFIVGEAQLEALRAHPVIRERADFVELDRRASVPVPVSTHITEGGAPRG